MVLAYPIGR
jgi:WD40 repeat protein